MPLPKYDPLVQFRGPDNYELAGKNLDIIMDDGNEYYVSFLDGEKLLWSDNKGAPVLRAYEAMKGETDLYIALITVSEEDVRNIYA